MRIDTNAFMTDAARKAVSILLDHGYKAYFVGGCVRDILLGVKPKDFDIATNASTLQVEKVFAGYGYKTHNNSRGEQHGTIIAVIGDESFEITTFRKEGPYSDGRHPDYVKFVDNLEDDLARRDFTINAMAADLFGNVIDPFNGMYDLRYRVIRCVGSISDRLNQDAIRVLRAIRFSCKLGFEMQLEIQQFINANGSILEDKGISVERIREEICKILVSDRAEEGMKNIISSKLIAHIAPELHPKLSTFLLRETPNDLIIRFSCLLFGFSAESAQEIIRKFKFDSDTSNNIFTLSYHVNHFKLDSNSKKNAKQLINSLGMDLLVPYFRIKRHVGFETGSWEILTDVNICSLMVKEILANHEPLTLKDLAVNGRDVIKAGVEPGEQVGLMLDFLMDKVLEDARWNTKERLLRLVAENKTFIGGQ